MTECKPLTNPVFEAIDLAKRLYELCHEPGVCAAVANMYWNADSPEYNSRDRFEDYLDAIGPDEPVDFMTAMRLPNFTAVERRDEIDGQIFEFVEDEK